MRKSVLSGLIAGALTIGAGICPPPVYAAGTANDGAQRYETEAVVVTASRSETAISDVPADVTLISGEQIERGNYKSVSDALKGANINVVQKGFAAYPIINGDTRVLVMVDGKKVNWDHLVVSGDTNAVDVDQIAIGDVERIEIVRGPNSSLYGERAVSGVINIITKRPTAGKPTARTASRSVSHMSAARISSIRTPTAKSAPSRTATSTARTTTSDLTVSLAMIVSVLSSAVMREMMATV